MQEIINSGDVCELEELDMGEDPDFADLTATTEPDPQTMNFHVQMRGYTMCDFETMVVHAAATQIVGGRDFTKEIREKAAEIATGKIDARLNEELKDVMSIVAMKRDGKDVTISELMGMEARAYLSETVDLRDGSKPDGWGSRKNQGTRAQFLIQQFIQSAFKKQISEQFDALKKELAVDVDAQIAAVVRAERERMAKALGYEIEKRR